MPHIQVVSADTLLASQLNIRLFLQRGYDEDWLGGTFSSAVFVGNGVMAIISGLVAHTLVEGMALGPVAPFDAAHAVLLLGGVVILATWSENFGEEEGKEVRSSFVGQIWAALRAIRKGASHECRLCTSMDLPYWDPVMGCASAVDASWPCVETSCVYTSHTVHTSG